MEGDSRINPPSIVLACWLFITAMISIGFASPLYNGPGHCPTELVLMPSNQWTLPRCNSAEKDKQLQPKSRSIKVNTLHEPSGSKILSSLPGRRQPSGLENALSSGHAKKKDSPFYPLILQAANRHQLDPALIKAVIMAESRYNPNAISKKGAKGLMQLMPGTAEALGVEDGFNPEHNIDAGVRYLKQLMNQFNGDLKLALAAYNAGSRRVREFQGIPPIKATQEYIKNVLKYYSFYKKQMAGEIGRL